MGREGCREFRLGLSEPLTVPTQNMKGDLSCRHQEMLLGIWAHCNNQAYSSIHKPKSNLLRSLTELLRHNYHIFQQNERCSCQSILFETCNECSIDATSSHRITTTATAKTLLPVFLPSLINFPMPAASIRFPRFQIILIHPTNTSILAAIPRKDLPQVLVTVKK